MADLRANDGGRATLVVMAKAPIPGYAKTRLIERLGPEGAAELHAVLLERTLRTAVTSGFEAVALWCAPNRAARLFEALHAAAAFDLRDQPEGDLGVRMLAAFEAHLPGGPVVMIGTDCPGLSVEHLAAVRAALARGADAAFVPAEDGGYAALGLARAHPSLFDDVPWGSPEVLATTRERIRRLGWTTHELGALRDVDVPDDVEWLLSSGLLSDAERARVEPYR